MRTKAGLIALLAAIVAGCSAVRFAYDNADVFLRWQAGRYLDVREAQSEELDARIAAFLAWHRANALPGYVKLAGEAASRMERGLSREDLVWGYDALRAEVRRALRAGADEAAALLDRLSPGQIAYLEQRFAEDNRRYAREHVAGTPEERRRQRFERQLERIEEWFGSLNDAQVGRVRRYSEHAPLDGEFRVRERVRLQAELLEIVRTRRAREKLADWAANWDRHREPEYAAMVSRMRAQYMDMLLDIDRTLTPAQREAAVARWRQFAADFEQLARR